MAVEITFSEMVGMLVNEGGAAFAGLASGADDAFCEASAGGDDGSWPEDGIGNDGAFSDIAAAADVAGATDLTIFADDGFRGDVALGKECLVGADVGIGVGEVLPGAGVFNVAGKGSGGCELKEKRNDGEGIGSGYGERVGVVLGEEIEEFGLYEVEAGELVLGFEGAAELAADIGDEAGGGVERDVALPT